MLLNWSWETQNSVYTANKGLKNANREKKVPYETYFPFKWHEPHRKWHLQRFFVAMGTSLQSYRRIHRQTRRHTCPTILLLLPVFVAAGMCLPSRCIAMKEGIHFNQHLLATIRGYTYIHRLMGGVVKYAIEMGSGAMICITSFIKTGSGIQNLMRGIHRHTAWRSCKSNLRTEV